MSEMLIKKVVLSFFQSRRASWFLLEVVVIILYLVDK